MATLKRKNDNWSHMLRTQIHLFKALVYPTFTYDTQIWGGDLKKSHWRAFEKAWRFIWCSCKGAFFDNLPYLQAKFGELPVDLYALRLIIGFRQRLTHLPPSQLVTQATHSPNTLPNKNFTPCTNWQPCGRHHGGSIPWGNHNKPSKFKLGGFSRYKKMELYPASWGRD